MSCTCCQHAWERSGYFFSARAWSYMQGLPETRVVDEPRTGECDWSHPNGTQLHALPVDLRKGISAGVCVGPSNTVVKGTPAPRSTGRYGRNGWT